MDSPCDITELRKQLAECLDSSQKKINKKITLITEELESIKKENEIMTSKVKVLFEKIDNYQESLNGTVLSEVIQPSCLTKKAVTPIPKHNSSSKINIQNLVINKRVQIGKNFSKLKINNFHTTANVSPDRINRSFYQRKKTPTKIQINSKNKYNSLTPTPANSFKVSHHIHSKSIIESKNNKKVDLKKNNSISDIRKLSIIDIPCINPLDNNTEVRDEKKKKKNSIFDYLFQKNQKLLLILAKSNVLPISLRKIFAKPIQFIYSYHDLQEDANALYESKMKELIDIKKDFIPFKLSLTSQFMLNFITKEQEKEYRKNHSFLSKENSKDLIIINVFSFLSTILNQNDLINNEPTIVADFFKRMGNYSLKEYIHEHFNHNLTINSVQLNHINSIVNSRKALLDDNELRKFEDDRITTLLLIVIKDVYNYSLAKINKYEMICYLSMIESLKRYKDDINNINY